MSKKAKGRKRVSANQARAQFAKTAESMEAYRVRNLLRKKKR